MSDSRVFVDTNIFLYAALEDDFQQGKRAGAVNLLKGLTDKLVYVNTQVLHEFYSIMLRHGASDEAIHDRLNAIIRETKVSVITVKTVRWSDRCRGRSDEGGWERCLCPDGRERWFPFRPDGGTAYDSPFGAPR
jgi:predicted nucleic acid-binding protein